MKPQRTRRPSRVAVLTVAAALLALSACGSGDTDTDSNAATGDASAASGAASDDATSASEALYESTFGEPPTSGPRAVAGKKLFIIPCGQQAAGCQSPAEAAVEAAESLGWETTTCDGKLNPATWATCIRQGIAAKPDAIATIAIDCSAVKQALVEARSAKVPVVNSIGFDCDEPSAGGGEKLYTTSLIPGTDYPTMGELYVAAGKARADWVISAVGPEATVLELDFQGTPTGGYLHQGFAEQMKTCSGCKVVPIPITLQSFGRVQQITQSALLQNPDAEALAVPLDSLMLAGVAPAVAQSGMAKKIAVMGGEGQPANLDLIRSGDGRQSAAVAQSSAWVGYATVDTVNRFFAGQPPVPEGLGFQVVDATKNLPGSGGYVPPVDFKAAYKSAWKG